MPWQLIYSSAPRGLLSGQSGFCTVARSADLREALAQRLEQLSSYHYLRVAEAATASRNPSISAFRLLDLRGAKYYVLTRIQPCGLDFTARTNHLAHHLVFQPHELTKLPSPAAILRHWPGWRVSWQGEPRFLEEIDPASFAPAAKSFLPAQTWMRLTGDGGRAAGLLESECVRGCYLVCPPGSEEQVLEMYCETLELLNPEGRFPLRPWRHGFTAFLQAEDNPNDFQWRACQENTPAYKQAVCRSAPLIALQSVRVPANDLVKKARGGPKPPPTQPPPAATQSWRLERPARTTSAPAPVSEFVNIKKPVRSEKPAFLDLNFSINSATLARLGIFVAVLVVLWLISQKLHKEPLEQGNSAPVPRLMPLLVTAPAPKTSATKEPPPVAATPDANQLDRLVGDGPTYVLEVTNLANFSLPISSIMRLQNLLKRYNHYDTLPNDIQLTVETDRWDFPPGAPMKVGAQKSEQFSASTPGLECVFGYTNWLAEKETSLEVQAHFDRVPGAFSLHFGFSSTNDGDPFRLLIVSEANPPAPLPLSKKFIQNARPNLPASMKPALRERLSDFHLLEGRQWQLQPLIGAASYPSQYLYKDWPTNDIPSPGHELDFAKTRENLQVKRVEMSRNLDTLSEPLGLTLGKSLGRTNADLESFRAFSHKDLTQRRFMEYLKELKNTAPDDAWIKDWPNKFDAGQPDEVSDNFQKLYELWSKNRPQDKPMLTVTRAGGKTNYFFQTWQDLKDVELLQEQLAKVQNGLSDLDHAYVGLCIIATNKPGPELEMIRFERP
jgi:hypothetical protein